MSRSDWAAMDSNWRCGLTSGPGPPPPPAHRPITSLPSSLVSPASPCLPSSHQDIMAGHHHHHPSPYFSPSSLSSSLYHSSRMALYGSQAAYASPSPLLHPYLASIPSPFSPYDHLGSHHGLGTHSGLSYPHRPLSAMPTDTRSSFWFPSPLDPCNNLLGAAAAAAAAYGSAAAGLYRFYPSPSQAPLSPLSDTQHLSPYSRSTSSVPSPVKETGCPTSRSSSRSGSGLTVSCSSPTTTGAASSLSSSSIHHQLHNHHYAPERPLPTASAPLAHLHPLHHHVFPLRPLTPGHMAASPGSGGGGSSDFSPYPTFLSDVKIKREPQSSNGTGPIPGSAFTPIGLVSNPSPKHGRPRAEVLSPQERQTGTGSASSRRLCVKREPGLKTDSSSPVPPPRRSSISSGGKKTLIAGRPILDSPYSLDVPLNLRDKKVTECSDFAVDVVKVNEATISTTAPSSDIEVKAVTNAAKTAISTIQMPAAALAKSTSEKRTANVANGSPDHQPPKRPAATSSSSKATLLPKQAKQPRDKSPSSKSKTSNSTRGTSPSSLFAGDGKSSLSLSAAHSQPPPTVLLVTNVMASDDVKVVLPKATLVTKPNGYVTVDSSRAVLQDGTLDLSTKSSGGVAAATAKLSGPSTFGAVNEKVNPTNKKHAALVEPLQKKQLLLSKASSDALINQTGIVAKRDATRIVTTLPLHKTENLAAASHHQKAIQSHIVQLPLTEKKPLPMHFKPTKVGSTSHGNGLTKSKGSLNGGTTVPIGIAVARQRKPSPKRPPTDATMLHESKSALTSPPQAAAASGGDGQLKQSNSPEGSATVTSGSSHGGSQNTSINIAPSGYQIARDAMTGQFYLIPAAPGFVTGSVTSIIRNTPQQVQSQQTSPAGGVGMACGGKQAGKSNAIAPRISSVAPTQPLSVATSFTNTGTPPFVIANCGTSSNHAGSSPLLAIATSIGFTDRAVISSAPVSAITSSAMQVRSFGTTSVSERATQACMSEEEEEALAVANLSDPEDARQSSMTTSGCQVDMDAEDGLDGRSSSLSICSDDSGKLTISDVPVLEPVSSGNRAKDAAPVMSAKSAPVMQFINSHGLDLLVDSVENFTPTHEDRHRSGNSAYESGLSLLSALAEQRSFEEMQKASELEKRRHSTDAVETSESMVLSASSSCATSSERMSQLSKPLKKRTRSESCQPAISLFDSDARPCGVDFESVKLPTIDERSESVHPPPKKKSRKESVTEIDPWAIRRSVRIFLHDSIVQAQPDTKKTSASTAVATETRVGSSSSTSGGATKDAPAKTKCRKKSRDDKSEAEGQNTADTPSEDELNMAEKQRVANTASCHLTRADLEKGVRVIVRIDNLLYAGLAEPITSDAPDIFGVTMDGDRLSKRQIYSLEGLLRDAVREVKPASVDEVPEESRVAAYWSHQYRCLYTGRTKRYNSPNPLPERNLVFVEFDDGDRGRIPLDDVRLLPNEYKHTPTKLPAKRQQQRPKSISNGDCDKMDYNAEAIVESQVLSPVLAGAATSSSSSPTTSCSSQENNQPSEQLSSLVCEKQAANCTNEEVAKLKKKKKHSKDNSEKQDICSRKHRHHHKHHGKHHHKKKRKHEKRRKESKDLPSSATSQTQKKLSESSSSETSNSQTVAKGPSTMVSATPTRTVQKMTVRRVKKSPKDKKLRISDFVLKSEPKSTNNMSGSEPSTTKLRIKRKAALMGQAKTTAACQNSSRNKEQELSSGTSDSSSSENDSDEESEAALPQSPSKRERVNSSERSKIAAFLPERQLWHWSGKSFKKTYGSRGKKGRKEFYREITRGKEKIRLGDSAVFLSTGRPHLPYVGRIDSMWETGAGNMIVKVRWFYHPEETKDMPPLVDVRGALFESPSHYDENDVQTISHMCEVLTYAEYQRRKKESPFVVLDDPPNVYYFGGTYDPLSGEIGLATDVPLKVKNQEKSKDVADSVSADANSEATSSKVQT